MKSLSLFLTYFGFLLILGCQGKNEKTEEGHLPLSEAILGSWENLSMKVEIITAANTPDSSSTFSVPAGQWEEILQLRPIKTIYKTDGYYVSLYTNLQDSIIDRSEGKWEVSGDSIYLDYQGKPFAYHTVINEDTAVFIGKVDWDQDGSIDDIYTGTQIRLAD